MQELIIYFTWLNRYLELLQPSLSGLFMGLQIKFVLGPGSASHFQVRT